MHPAVTDTFDVKILRYASADGIDKSVIDRQLITYENLLTLAAKESVPVWNIPLSALQRKIGASGRFCLPGDAAVIDDVLDFTLYEYLQASDMNLPRPMSGRRVLMLYYVSTKQASKQDAGTGGGSADLKGPMREKDWDYVFQANSILNCSMIQGTDFKKAPFAAFRIRDSNEDDAELPLPIDDTIAKIPAWSLSTRPARTYMTQTSYELENKALESSHSKKGLSVGLEGEYKKFTGSGSYERDTERSFTDERSYGNKQSRMYLIHEVPVVEISLHKGNSRLSDSCRQALLNLRKTKSFGHLMEFFENYGTIYAKRVVLGGRLINRQETFHEETSQTIKREQNTKQKASVSLGIKPFSISGGYSSEQGFASSNTDKQDVSQKAIDWFAYGGNPSLSNKPDEWQRSLEDYHFWEIVDNSEVESIQSFIGSLPDFTDIPGLFDRILRSGLYDPMNVVLAQGNSPLPPPPAGSPNIYQPIGAAVNALTGEFSKEPLFGMGVYPDLTRDLAPSSVVTKGGLSWQVLERRSSVREEISSYLQTVTNIGTNRRAIPAWLYELTMDPRTVTVLLQWSTDVIGYGVVNDRGKGKWATRGTWLWNRYKTECGTLLAKSKQVRVGASFTTGLPAVIGYEEVLDALRALLTAAKDISDSPLYRSAAILADVWSSAASDLKSVVAGSTFGGKKAKQEEIIVIESLSMMDELIKKLITANGDGSNNIIFQDFILAKAAIDALSNEDPDKGASKFVSEYGHNVVQGYTEAGLLSAVWQIQLACASDAEMEVFRLYMQRFFMKARSVPEVYTFFESGIAASQFAAFNPTTQVSIFGYRDPATLEEHKLINLPAQQAKDYLTRAALERNRTRTSYRVQPLATLQVHFDTDDAGKLAQESFKRLAKYGDNGTVMPDARFVHSLEDILQKLLLLNAYSKVPAAEVDVAELTENWKTFNLLEGPVSMDQNGKLSEIAADGLKKLTEALCAKIQSAEAKLAAQPKSA